MTAHPDDEALEVRLRRYRPAGPSAQLRDRILANVEPEKARAVRPRWLGLAALLLMALTFGWRRFEAKAPMRQPETAARVVRPRASASAGPFAGRQPLSHPTLAVPARLERRHHAAPPAGPEVLIPPEEARTVQRFVDGMRRGGSVPPSVGLGTIVLIGPQDVREDPPSLSTVQVEPREPQGTRVAPLDIESLAMQPLKRSDS